MGWKETCVLKERLKFISAWETEWEEMEGRVNVAALCRAFGVSRVTGYKWINRYVDGGRKLETLANRSRKPSSSPNATPPEWVDLVLAARAHRPRWGARKLQVWLRRYVLQRRGLRGVVSLAEIPKPSTITAILRRHGLTRHCARRHRVPPRTRPFHACTQPNDTWCVDFKGHFRTADGTRVYPLTIMDACSRFLIRCELVTEPDAASVIPIFRSAFDEFGLPLAIRSDNGPPFASRGPGGLTSLSAWWVRLGIRHDRIAPGKPQENGRHERMHLTLKQETALPPAQSPRSQQHRFNQFRKIYNTERPHEALAMEVPASIYRRSTRPHPKHLLRLEYPGHWEERRVERNGKVKFGRSSIHVGEALHGEFVGLCWARERRWEVYFGPLLLGLFDAARPRRGLQSADCRIDDELAAVEQSPQSRDDVKHAPAARALEALSAGVDIATGQIV